MILLTFSWMFACQKLWVWDLFSLYEKKRKMKEKEEEEEGREKVRKQKRKKRRWRRRKKRRKDYQAFGVKDIVSQSWVFLLEIVTRIEKKNLKGEKYCLPW